VQGEKEIFFSLHPEKPWLEMRKEEINSSKVQEPSGEEAEEQKSFAPEISIGGGEKLSGAAYFWFFTILMLATASLFVVVAWLYKPREYLQEEAEA